jgi:predicted HicB family RNase H-like nuclease
MHSRVRSASLTETLGIRVTEDERNTLQIRAEEAGISLSEWCRQLLRRALPFGRKHA